MLQSIQTKGISLGSIFKILFLGLLFSLGPLFIIAAVCSYFGFHVLSLNHVYVTGLKGLITGLIMAPAFPLLFAVLFCLFIKLGLWVFTRFTSLAIYFKPIS